MINYTFMYIYTHTRVYIYMGGLGEGWRCTRFNGALHWFYIYTYMYIYVYTYWFINIYTSLYIYTCMYIGGGGGETLHKRASSVLCIGSRLPRMGTCVHSTCACVCVCVRKNVSVCVCGHVRPLLLRMCACVWERKSFWVCVCGHVRPLLLHICVCVCERESVWVCVCGLVCPLHLHMCVRVRERERVCVCVSMYVHWTCACVCVCVWVWGGMYVHCTCALSCVCVCASVRVCLGDRWAYMSITPAHVCVNIYESVLVSVCLCVCDVYECMCAYMSNTPGQAIFFCTCIYTYVHINT